MTQETSSDTNHSFSAKGTGNASLFPQVPSQRISKRFEFFFTKQKMISSSILLTPILGPIIKIQRF